MFLVPTYVDGGTVTRADYTVLDVSNAVYNNSTGIITITTASAHSLSASAVVKIQGLKYHCKDGEKIYPKVGHSSVWNVVVKGGVAEEIITYHGGADFQVGDVITLDAADVGNGGDLTLTVKSLEDNNASNMFLLNDKNNMRNMTL